MSVQDATKATTNVNEVQNSSNSAPKPFGFMAYDMEERIYILLFYFSEECREYEIIVGRKSAYTVAKEYVKEGADLTTSIVLAQRQLVEEGVKLYDFMKEMAVHYPDPEFDIEAYNTEDIPSDSTDTYNPGFGYVATANYIPTASAENKVDAKEDSDV